MWHQDVEGRLYQSKEPLHFVKIKFLDGVHLETLMLKLVLNQIVDQHNLLLRNHRAASLWFWHSR